MGNWYNYHKVEGYVNDTKPGSVDSYIEAFPKDSQAIFQKIRQVVYEVIPNATETISYGIPTFDLNGAHVLHIGAYKNHIGMYPMTTVSGELRKRLQPYITGKGTAQFPLNKPVPYDLIRAFVEHRLQEVLAKAK